MSVSELISKIAASADAIKAEGATALFIYGSRARVAPRTDSELDVFVDYPPMPVSR